ncbi:MAG: hypothetical protein IKZ09_12725, partial [Clostridia bacterium]|nr:hypothetical protein [Clostridia bacterium]
MKKTHFTIFISIIMMIFSSCAHEHQFQPATCTKPQVCIECGESMGESLGHDYTDATCTKPQICTKCDEIVGEPLGHDYTAATCIRA